jgi:hypothetical protein
LVLFFSFLFFSFLFFSFLFFSFLFFSFLFFSFLFFSSIYLSFSIISQGGRTALEHYNGSLVKALIDVYPNLQIDEMQFRTIRSMLGREREREREGERERRGDGRGRGEGRESEREREREREREGEANLNTGHYWQDPIHKRNFFEELARKRKFNPRLPSNWYTITADIVVNEKVFLINIIYIIILIINLIRRSMKRFYLSYFYFY